MTKKALLEVRVDMNGPGFRMETDRGEISMIPFSGIVQGELFHGIVEPWGVDTQRVDHAGIRHLSARYVLTGKDRDGQDCHIFVENSVDMPNIPSPSFKSVPVFYTDSKLLAPLLHRDVFYGEGNVEDGKLWIRFYEV